LDTVLGLEKKISVREKEDLRVGAVPTATEKVQPVEKGEAVAGSVAPGSIKPVAPEIPRPTTETAKPRRTWGCLLATFGALILIVGAIVVASIGAQFFAPGGSRITQLGR
jgi:hypothetical protein